MRFRHHARMIGAAALIFAMGTLANAQQRPSGPANPSPAALLMAKELIDLKGAAAAYDPIVVGVVEYHKNFFLQTNPNLSKDLNEVARKLVGELSSRKVEMQQQITRIYASHFTEQELKDALAFYKTPLGRKLISEEPKVLEETLKAADAWSKKLADEVSGKFRAEMQKRGHGQL